MPDQPPVHDLAELERLLEEATPEPGHVSASWSLIAAVVYALPDLLAVVGAAKEYRSASWGGPPYSKERATRIVKARDVLDAALRPFYGDRP